MSARDPSEEQPPAAERDGARLLARRPLSVAELRERLSRAGHPSSAVESACDRFLREGYLDDRRLATDYIVTRALRLGHGPERLVRELCERGIEPDVARAALRQAIREGDLDPREVLRRRVGRLLPADGKRLDERSWRRVYNALIRAGFDSESVRRELEPYLDPSDPHERNSSDESHDDFA